MRAKRLTGSRIVKLTAAAKKSTHAPCHASYTLCNSRVFFIPIKHKRRLLGHGLATVLLLEVSLLADGVGLDGVLAGVPVGRADLGCLLISSRA